MTARGVPGSNPGMTSFAKNREFQMLVRDLAARCARVVHGRFAQRGRGECRAPVAPAAARVV
jgi:hypothetical protein